jgi:hypothetical protein
MLANITRHTCEDSSQAQGPTHWLTIRADAPGDRAAQGSRGAYQGVTSGVMCSLYGTRDWRQQPLPGKVQVVLVTKLHQSV